MKKKLLLTIMSASAALGINAAVLTPEEALSRLGADGPMRVAANELSAMELKYSAHTESGNAALYVFNKPEQRGYLLVSADDCTAPLLGYCDSGSFDEEHMAPAMKYWIDSYARQISYLQTYNLAPMRMAESEYDINREPIEPLVKTKWDQDAPYSDECPEQDGLKCYTGCVATSMSQVMKYFQYPEKGTGMVSYTCSTLGKKLAMNIGKEPLDWDNMLLTYNAGEYTEEQGHAVAYLMKACGYTVQMQYTTSMSGAYSFRIKDALINNFGYDEGITYLDRSNYSYQEWANLLYDNIQKIGPVIYDGASPLDGGHSFICDGYDGNGYFHFNWGWSGMSDGYFLLDALNPASLGIGGGSMGGFNFDQDAVFGIQPPTGQVVKNSPVGVQYGVLFGEVDITTLNLGTKDAPECGWGYNGDGEAVMSFGVIIENLDDAGQPVQYYANQAYSNIPFTSGQYIPFEGKNYYKIPLRNLEINKNQRYKFTFASRVADDESSEWTPVETKYGYSNYIVLTKSGLSYEVENIPVANMNVSDIELLSTLYNGCPVRLKTTISNNTSYQLSQGITFELYNTDGEKCFTSDSFFLTLNPGESENQHMVVSFYSTNSTSVTADTEFDLKVVNLETGMYYDTPEMKVTMRKNPGKPTIISKLKINNANVDKDGVYVIGDSHNIDITVTMKVGRGYFAYPVTVYLMEEDESGKYLLPLINQTFADVPFLNAGEDVELHCTLDFPNPDPSKNYYVQSRYSTDMSYVWMSNQTVIRFDKSGVEGVEVDNSNAPVKYFNLQGVEIANPAKGQLVIKRQGTSSKKMIAE